MLDGNKNSSLIVLIGIIALFGAKKVDAFSLSLSLSFRRKPTAREKF